MKKRFWLALIFVIICLVGVLIFSAIRGVKYKHYGDLVGQSSYVDNNMYGIPLYKAGELAVFKDNNRYVVTIVEEYKIKSIGVLSKNGKWLYTKNLELMRFDYRLDYIGLSFGRIKERHGDNHINLNSGDIWQAYLTVDAKIVAFHIDSKYKIFDVEVIDLLEEIKRSE